MAGMAACLWQAKNSLSNMELLQLVRQLGSNAANPNNSIGYGVPHYNRLVTSLAEEQPVGISISNPVSEEPIVLRMEAAWRNEQALAQVYDAAGKLLHTQTLPANTSTHTLSIRTERLKKGVYLCQISSGNERVTLRFVKL